MLISTTVQTYFPWQNLVSHHWDNISLTNSKLICFGEVTVLLQIGPNETYYVNSLMDRAAAYQDKILLSN
jgi:hypothetical protein